MTDTQWRKSTYTISGNCVEVRYVSASASVSNGNCVQVAALDYDCVCCPDAKRGTPVILVRDSKDPDGPHLHFTRGEWDAFVNGVKAGEFDTIADTAQAAA